MGEVEVDTALLQGLVALGVFEYLHQGEQGGQAYLMVGRKDALLEVVEGALFPYMIDHFAGTRHLDSKELVALAILPRGSLEETGQAFDLRVVA